MIFKKLLLSTAVFSLLTGMALPASANHYNHAHHIRIYRLIPYTYHRMYWYTTAHSARRNHVRKSVRRGHKAAMVKHGYSETIDQEHLADLREDLIQDPQHFGLSNNQAMHIFTRNQSYSQLVKYIAKVSHRSPLKVSMSIHHFINQLISLPGAKNY